MLRRQLVEVESPQWESVNRLRYLQLHYKLRRECPTRGLGFDSHLHS